jgi:hypothetical protein
MIYFEYISEEVTVVIIISIFLEGLKNHKILHLE